MIVINKSSDLVEKIESMNISIHFLKGQKNTAEYESAIPLSPKCIIFSRKEHQNVKIIR
jgi:hypothetical protein